MKYSILIWLVIPAAALSFTAHPGQDLLNGDGAALTVFGDSPPDRAWLPSSSAASSIVFTANIPIDDVPTNEKNFMPSAKRLADGSLAVVWGASEKYYNEAHTIRFSRSWDQGDTWGPSTVVVDKSETGQVSLWRSDVTELDNGTLAVVWHGLKWNGLTYFQELWFKRSLDGGTTWSGLLPLPLPNVSGGKRVGYNPVILAVGDTLIVTYADGPNGGNSWCILSLDSGNTWSAPLQVTPSASDIKYSDSGLSWDPVHQRLLTIFDVGEQIFVIPSDDLGQSWGAPVLVSTPGAVHTDFPALATGADGRTYASWNQVEGGTDTEIFAAVSADGGVSWSTPVQIDDGTPAGNQYEPHLFVDAAGTAHAAWVWNIPGEGDIDLYYSRSTDGGATWMTPQPRVNDVRFAVAPYVAYSFDILADADGTAFLFWNDNRAGIGYRNIMFSRSEADSPWSDLGQGLAGTGGLVPELEGSGPLTSGSLNQLDLSDALPNTSTYLVLGLSLLEAPFKGGVLVPFPDLILSDLPVDASGTLGLPFTWPAGIPAGTGIWFQHWIVDPGGPFGFSASNSLEAEAQ